MLRLLSIPLLLALLLAAAITWSGGGAEPRRADFTFISVADVNTLDISQISYQHDLRLAGALYEGLYSLDGQTLEPVPGVARGCDVSPDNTVYTFHLRPDARWSNGDPVTAGDFVFAWRRILENPGEYTYLHYYIRGAEAYCAGFARNQPVDFRSVGVEAPDPLTLRVTLANPVPFFLDLAAFGPFYPLHEPSMRPFAHVGPNGRVVYDQQFTRPPNLVSNGPFRLVRWDFKRRLLLERNEHYWDRANVRSRSLEMAVVEDPLTMFRRYEHGLADWLPDVPGEVGPELMTHNRADMHNFAGFGTWFIVLNCQPMLPGGRPNPMADHRVRRALGMAIDKDVIVRTITRMGETPATTYIPPGVFPGYRAAAGPGFDPPAARALLAQAGYPGAAGLPPLTLLFVAERPVMRDWIQNVARQWAENLNIHVALQTMELKTFRTRVNAHDFDIVPASWIGDYNDPSTFTDKFRPNSDNNDAAWVDAEYDRLTQAAAREPDPHRRYRLIERAESRLNQQMPIIPLFHMTNSYMFRSSVKGINLNPRSMTVLKAVYVEGRR